MSTLPPIIFPSSSFYLCCTWLHEYLRWVVVKLSCSGWCSITHYMLSTIDYVKSVIDMSVCTVLYWTELNYTVLNCSLLYCIVINFFKFILYWNYAQFILCTFEMFSYIWLQLYLGSKNEITTQFFLVN